MPPQGLKILCFKKGDLWITRRFEYKGENIWLEIPYGGKNGSIATDEPEYWCQVELPEGYTGYMKVSVDDGENLMTVDELQQNCPEDHEDFVKVFVKSIKNRPISKQK